jgi:hypothetical protein
VLLLASLAVLATGSAAGAANLVENPRFDDDIAGWSPFGVAVLQHSTVDELGSLASGSIEIGTVDPDDSTIGAHQCIPVVPGTTYAFGASARIPEGLPVNAAFVTVIWSSMANCFSGDIDAEIPLPYFLRLQGAWGTTQNWATAPPGAQAAQFVLRANKLAPPGPIRVAFDNAFFLEDETCGPSPTTLCLNDERFRVIVEWKTKQGDLGFGRAVKLTDDSGYLWFFNDANVEIVAKLLDACDGPFNTFWFFAAGLTNVEVTIRVHDTRTDVGKVYTNPLETPFAPIQDTEAFETCQAIGG